MLNALVSRLFPQLGAQQRELDRDSERIYAQIVAQARRPAFYADLGVPDTPTGRFEMIVAHAALIFRHLRDDGKPSVLAQSVFDLLFADMDRSLRELGVGDLSVPKKIKKMGQMFYGRAAAYGKAIDEQDGDELALAVAENILAQPCEGVTRDHAVAIAEYLIASDAMLGRAGREAMLAGDLVWPAITTKSTE